MASKICTSKLSVKEYLDRSSIKYEGQIDQGLSCIERKQHKLQFSSSDSRSDSPDNLIHVDLCGPMEVKSIGGSLYFLLLRDDYSSYRFAYFLKSKYETKTKIEEFINMFENNNTRDQQD